MILLLNPNTSAATTGSMVEIAREAVPDLPVRGVTAPFGLPLLIDPAALARGAEAVAAMADGLDAEVRGVIVAAYGDPGLDMLRKRLSIPVTGIGEASFHEAAQGARRFGVATTIPALEAAIAERVLVSGFADLFTGCRFVLAIRKCSSRAPICCWRNWPEPSKYAFGTARRR